MLMCRGTHGSVLAVVVARLLHLLRVAGRPAAHHLAGVLHAGGRRHHGALATMLRLLLLLLLLRVSLALVVAKAAEVPEAVQPREIIAEQISEVFHVAAQEAFRLCCCVTCLPCFAFI
jgi:hypothetical protein